jgi:hypothetical protein
MAIPSISLHMELPNRSRRSYVYSYLLNGLGLADGVVVAVGLALGVAVGIAVGAGDGVVGFGVAPVAGVAAGRIPEEIPGAAGRNPSGLASVDPVLFGAGPAVEGALAELRAPWFDVPL